MKYWRLLPALIWLGPTRMMHGPLLCCTWCCTDAASDYANEVEVGAGINAAMTEFGVKRSDLWVTSKLWNTQHRAEHVRPACEATLRDLGLGMFYLIQGSLCCEH